MKDDNKLHTNTIYPDKPWPEPEEELPKPTPPKPHTVQCMGFNNIYMSMSYLDLSDFRHAQVRIIAYHIHKYRHKVQPNRISDSLDDWGKAEYMYDLFYYLYHKGVEFPIRYDDKNFEKMVSIVYAIFDHAYFLQYEYPDWSDFERFVEAERRYCPYKHENSDGDKIKKAA